MGIFSKLILFLLIFLQFKLVKATTYIPSYSKVLFTEIDGWVKGIVTDISYKRDSDKSIYTVLSLDLEEFSGISKSEIPNYKNFNIYFPGGKWQGVNLKYSGAPKFSIGDRYIFLLNKRKGGFYVSGLNAGLIPLSNNSKELINDLKTFSLKKFSKINSASKNRANNKLILRKARMPSVAKVESVKPLNYDSGDKDELSIILIVFIAILILFFFLFVGRDESSKS